MVSAEQLLHTDPGGVSRFKVVDSGSSCQVSVMTRMSNRSSTIVRDRPSENDRWRQWRIQDLQTGGARLSAAGASIEAPKAPKEVECEEGVFPSPLGKGSGEGAAPPPQKFFLTLGPKCLLLVHSELYFCSSATYCTSKKQCSWAYETCCCSLHAMHSTERAIIGGKHKPVGK